ncbi:hypothetical protein G7Y79_00078g100020 [Physcia stellaris]|nr:hypothetical protein G7Y79_00078g100020 [Physcia stellaris]
MFYPKSLGYSAEHTIFHQLDHRVRAMDPVSFAASLAALIQLSTKVAQYLKEVKSGSEDRIRLRDELRGTNCLLEMLQDRMDDAEFLKKDLASIGSLDIPGGPLEQLTKALEQLERKLAPSRRLKQISKAVLWPFSKEEVNEIISTIERQKTAFNLAISNDNIALSLSIKTGVRELGAKMTSMEIRQENDRRSVESQEDTNIINWLSPLNFTARQQDILGTRTKDTGLWLFETAEFQSWRSSSNNVLWCYGIPGADLISSLIQQLLQRGSPMPEALRSLYDQNKEQGRPPLEAELLDLLNQVLSHFSTVFFVIDALDESREDDGTRNTLITKLRELLPNVRFLYTSRRLTEIERQFEGCFHLEIRATNEDIRRHLESRISEEPRLLKHIAADPSLLQLISETVVGKSDGMFLLAQLHLAALAAKHTRKALRLSLQNLPKELDTTYKEALQRIYDQNREDASLAEQVLMWVSYAASPLTITQLQHAVASLDLETGVDIDDEDLPDEDILISVCAGLVAKDKESNIIRLVHYTTQEYFERNPIVDRDVAQKKVSSACIAYLSQDVFSHGPCENNATLHLRLEKYPFVAYAALNWGKHTRGLPEESCNDKIVQFLQNANLRGSTIQIFTSSTKIDRRLYRSPSWSQNYRRDVPMLALAADLGLTKVVRQLLDDHQDHKASDSAGETALHWAAAAGEMDTVQILLAAGADVHREDIRGESPLVAATRNQHLDIVDALIQHGADLTTQGSAALTYALSNGDDSMARLLFEKGAASGGRGDYLEAAVCNGDPSLVELTIEKLDIEIDSIMWRLMANPLPVSVIELLVQKGVDLNYAEPNGTTALHVAARHGSLEAVSFLLRCHVDPNRKTHSGYTPLHWAAFRGHTEVVRFLVDHEADSAAQNHAGETALHVCLHHTYNEDIVVLLSSKRCLLDVVDDRGRTALHEAACRGFSNAVMILIDRGATVDLQDNKHWTPLQHAAAGGHEQVINHLLGRASFSERFSEERLLRAAQFRNAVATSDRTRSHLLLKDPNLNISLPDHEGRTALHHAANNGDIDMVTILLGRGASVHAKIADTAYIYKVDYHNLLKPREVYECQWVTPLHIGAGRGHVEVVAVLLDYGADLHIVGMNGYTALEVAVRDRQVSVVKLLLYHGADISDRRDPEGRSPLYYAALFGYTEIVQLLLERGAQKERDTFWGKQALAVAANQNFLDVVRLLKSYGFEAHRI